jgi:hypothetical protein
MESPTARCWNALALGMALLVSLPGTSRCELKSSAVGGFLIEHEIFVAGTPEEAFDAFTRETMAWWDHTHSRSPKALYIEPRPGGGFYEIFDDEGNGALHATVIYAHRGKKLRFSGPLGFSGMALEMVHTLDFEAAENGKTRIFLSVRGAGQLQEDWAEGIDKVWHHFLVERFQPYMAARTAGQKE